MNIPIDKNKLRDRFLH